MPAPDFTAALDAYIRRQFARYIAVFGDLGPIAWAYYRAAYEDVVRDELEAGRTP